MFLYLKNKAERAREELNLKKKEYEEEENYLKNKNELEYYQNLKKK
jgi:hypothetical protein